MVSAPKNLFKQRLLAGEVLSGIWFSSASPVLAEHISLLGFDWMLIDTEHSPLDVAMVQPLLQAAAGGVTPPVVRPAWNDKVLIKRMLDMGALTLLIPFVETADEAEAAVAATRYPPKGIRGVAGATRASRYGQASDYFAVADQEICVLVQIETAAALARIDEIASVPGVDGVFIGPSDLAASMGLLGKPGAPEVQEALKSAVERLKAIGKPAGILATTIPDASRYLGWGYSFVAGGTDLGLLAGAGKALLGAMREATPAK